MRTDFAVILDACVLAPPIVCDIYLRLAEEPRLYSPLWSADILAEVHRTQIKKFEWPESLADYWQDQVGKAFPEAVITGYELLIPSCTNHEKDRHVLAAAIKAPAYAIVTFNRKDFPPSALEPHSVVTHDPADYLITLYDMEPGVVTTKINEIVQGKGWAMEEYLLRVAKVMPRFAHYFARKIGLRLKTG